MLFPNMKETIRVWREEAFSKGVELYLCRVETMDCYGEEYLQDGFDAAVEFQPFTHQMNSESHTKHTMMVESMRVVHQSLFLKGKRKELMKWIITALR